MNRLFYLLILAGIVLISIAYAGFTSNPTHIEYRIIASASFSLNLVSGIMILLNASILKNNKEGDSLLEKK